MIESKVCRICGIDKPLSEFHLRNKRKGLFRKECKKCVVAYNRELYREKAAKRLEKLRQEHGTVFRNQQGKGRLLVEQPPVESGERICVRCGERKPFEEMVQQSTCEAGVANRCRECDRKRQNERNRKNPQLGRDRARRFALSQFGLTVEDYDAMLEYQGGVCAICKGECNSGRRLAVDHCHKTGNVRGLLCGRCNLSIGKFEDNIDFLKTAISYLER